MLPRALLAALTAAAAVAIAAAPATANSTDTLRVYGWAYIGDEVPLTGGSVVVTDHRGKRVPGISTRTGAHGEFVLETRRSQLPGRVHVAVGRGFVDDDGPGGRRPTRLDGWLRSPVDMDGPEAGLVYVTPVSTLAIALTPRYGSYARASSRARALMGLPKGTQSAFEPWSDGGARTHESRRLIDPQRLTRDIESDGGLPGWIADMRARDRAGAPENYRPVARRTSAAAHAQHATGTGSAKGAGVAVALGAKAAPFFSAASSIWGVIADQAKTCNPGQSVIPGLGPLSTWVQEQGVVQRDPACDLGSQIEALGQQLNTRLDDITSQLDGLQGMLVDQAARLGGIETAIRQAASDSAWLTLSTSIAAIRTVQERRRLLADILATYAAPPTPSTPDGLGMDIDQIRASSDPRAVRAADVIRRHADMAYGPSVSGWDTVATRLAEPGVIVPGRGGRGALRTAWDSMWSPGALAADEIAAFNLLVDHYRSLWFLHGVQEVDALRRDGVPLTLIQRRLTERGAFDDALAGLIGTVPTPAYPTERQCSIVLRATQPVTCHVPSTRPAIWLSAHSWSDIGRSVDPPWFRVCAIPGRGVRGGTVRVFDGFLWRNARVVSIITVPRCDAIAPGSPPPWPPRMPGPNSRTVTKADVPGEARDDRGLGIPPSPLRVTVFR
jgi:hypothetical protein